MIGSRTSRSIQILEARTPYSLNWEFVNSQNKVSDVFDLNMSRICGGKEWILQKAKTSKSIKMIVLANGTLE